MLLLLLALVGKRVAINFGKYRGIKLLEFLLEFPLLWVGHVGSTRERTHAAASWVSCAGPRERLLFRIRGGLMVPASACDCAWRGIL